MTVFVFPPLFEFVSLSISSNAFVPNILIKSNNVGLALSADSRVVEVTIDQPVCYLQSVTAARLDLTATGASHVYIDELTVSGLNSTNDQVQVIAGDVSGLIYWTIDLTVRVSLDLGRDDSVPFEQRRRNARLTVSDGSTIHASSPVLTFMNSSSFPGSRYYVRPSSLPTLAGFETSSSGPPGRYIGPRAVAPVLCGVDCGKFEILVKSFSWYSSPSSTTTNLPTAEQTCIKYSDYYQLSIPATESNLSCVALRATDYNRALQTSLTYPQATLLGLTSYEPVLNAIPEATQRVTIAGSSSSAYYNSFPLAIDFEQILIQDLNLRLGEPPDDRPVSLKIKSQQIAYLSLDDLENGPVTLSPVLSSNLLSPKNLYIGNNWQLSSAEALDWGSLQSIDCRYALYMRLGENATKVPAQTIRYVNRPSNLADQQVTLQPRGITFGSSGFPAPDSGGFSLELQIGGTGQTTCPSPDSCTTDSVELGKLTFGGSGPDPDGEIMLDFTQGSLTVSNSRLVLSSDAGWTAPGNLIIRAGTVEFDVQGAADKSFNYTLRDVSHIYLTPSDSEGTASSTVDFTGVIQASSLSITKSDNTQVVFNHLELTGTASGLCDSERWGTTCEGADITNAALSDLTLPIGWRLTDNVSVSGTVTIEPAAFRATSVSLDETSRLIFNGDVPAYTGALVGKFNLTKGLGQRSVSDIVNDKNNSLHGEFNRTRSPDTLGIICGKTFATCEAWIANLDFQVTSDDLGSGVRASGRFYCGDGPSAMYALVWPESGKIEDVAIKADRQCALFEVSYTDGDPTSPHYSGPESGPEGSVCQSGAQADSEGLGAGGAAAIALGVILFLVIVGIVVVVVLGKVGTGFTHQHDDADA